MTTVFGLGLIESPQIPCRRHETETERLIRLIRAGDAAGAGQLYAMLQGGIRFFLTRALGAACADDVDTVFLFVFHAIRRGELNDSEALIPFALAAVKDYGLARLHDQRIERPEACANGQESRHDATMSRVLREISQGDREVLVRFYVRKQTATQIMHDMDLSPAQFSATKTRARMRFAELEGEAPLTRKPVGRITRDRAVAACL